MSCIIYPVNYGYVYVDVASRMAWGIDVFCGAAEYAFADWAEQHPEYDYKSTHFVDGWDEAIDLIDWWIVLDERKEE